MGRASSRLATAYFCWFPPERVRIGASASGQRTSRRLVQSRVDRRSRRRLGISRPYSRRVREGHVVDAREVHEDPATLAILAHVGDPGLEGLPGGSESNRGVVEPDLSRRVAADAGDGLGHLRPAASHESRDPEDLARRDAEADVPCVAGDRQSADVEPWDDWPPAGPGPDRRRRAPGRPSSPRAGGCRFPRAPSRRPDGRRGERRCDRTGRGPRRAGARCRGWPRLVHAADAPGRRAGAIRDPRGPRSVRRGSAPGHPARGPSRSRPAAAGRREGPRVASGG